MRASTTFAAFLLTLWSFAAFANIVVGSGNGGYTHPIYVSNDGDDRNDGKDRERPKRSIANATAARPGAVVLTGRGPFVPSGDVAMVRRGSNTLCTAAHAGQSIIYAHEGILL